MSETMRYSCGATSCAEDAIVSKSEVTFPSPIKVPHSANLHQMVLRLLQAIVDPIVDHFLDPDKAMIEAEEL